MKDKEQRIKEKEQRIKAREERVKHLKERILSQNEVDDMIGISRSTRHRLEGQGQFPKRKQYAPNRVGYPSSEILEFIRDPEGWRARHAADPVERASLRGAAGNSVEKKAAALA